MTNPVWVDLLLLLCFFLVLLAGFLYGWLCASGFKANFKIHWRDKGADFNPEELRKLSPRTRAILLKHKSEILKTSGGKQ